VWTGGVRTEGRSADTRSAEAKRRGEERMAEPTWHSLHVEARSAQRRGPQGPAEIFVVVICGGRGRNGDVCDQVFGTVQVIIPKGCPIT